MYIPMLLDESIWLDYVRDRGVGAIVCLAKVPTFFGCLGASTPRAASKYIPEGRMGHMGPRGKLQLKFLCYVWVSFYSAS